MDEIRKAIMHRNDQIRHNVNDTFEKGKTLPIGTIRERPNGNFIKTAQGWKYHSSLSGDTKSTPVDKTEDQLRDDVSDYLLLVAQREEDEERRLRVQYQAVRLKYGEDAVIAFSHDGVEGLVRHIAEHQSKQYGLDEVIEMTKHHSKSMSRIKPDGTEYPSHTFVHADFVEGKRKYLYSIKRSEVDKKDTAHYIEVSYRDVDHGVWGESESKARIYKDEQSFHNAIKRITQRVNKYGGKIRSQQH